MSTPIRAVSVSAWTSWTLAVTLAAFAVATSDIPFSNKEISLREASAAASWSKIINRDGAIFWLLTAASFSTMLAWAKLKNPRTRLWFSAAIFLLPVALAVITTDFDKIRVWLMSFLAAPVIVYELLFTALDGEFYNEGVLFFAALGWWNLLWLGLLILELRKNAAQKSVISPYSFPIRKSR